MSTPVLAMLAEAADALVTVRDVIRFGMSRMHAAGVFFGHGFPDARTEAAYLTGWAIDLPPGMVEDFLDARLTRVEREKALVVLARRIDERLPAAYITGEAWLGEHVFRSDRRAIVPRSFIADLLPDDLAPWVGEEETVTDVLDMCTGSGCLAILAGMAYPEARVVAADISPEALSLAQENIATFGLEAQVIPVESDLFAGCRDETFDVILCNPPYVDAMSMAALPPEYQHEPVLALASGQDGLDFLRRLLPEAHARLKPRGVLVVEVGHNADVLEEAFPDVAFTWLETHAGPRHVFLLTRDDLPH
jgi:ribosomal protein L3 glutamine methyltransferase